MYVLVANKYYLLTLIVIITKFIILLAFFSSKFTVLFTVEIIDTISRPNWLFDVWNKYEPRFPALFFFNKLVSMGDFMVDVGAYDVASRQCYRRYLVTRYNEVPADRFEDPHSYKETFFKSEEKEVDHILTARALLVNNLYKCGLVWFAYQYQFFSKILIQAAKT